MNSRTLAWIVAAAATFAAAPSQAQFTLAVSPINTGVFTIQPTWKCRHADRTACTSAELSNPWYKQIVVLSAGFQDADRDTFFAKFDLAADQMTGPSAGNVWSRQYANRLLFVGYFTGGGALGSVSSSFGAKVASHPIRGYALTLRQADVYAKIEAIRSEIGALRPFGAGVLFNTTQSPVTANASPPSFAGKSYGIAKFSVHDVEASSYVTTHELAHACLNFLDEYVERGLEDQSIKSFDVLTPLLQLDGTWGGWASAISDLYGNYSVQVSEIFANNGNDNVSTSRYPSTVYTPSYSGEDYQYEGGMFFGRGVWHMPGLNLMGGGPVSRGSQDGFGYAHSPAQQRVVNQAFNAGSARPNDRLLNAGPVNGWPLSFGSTTHVMLRDADRNHQFQPTQSYTVQVGFYDRQWKTCWASFIPYPCYDDIWTTAEKSVYKSARSFNVKLSAAFGVANVVQNLLCQLGVQEAGSFRLCEQPLDTITEQFLPAIQLPSPYQDVDVPASQWNTTYWWRFRSNNGAIVSGWTAWSTFFRSL